jgi:hypothetical protein
MAYKLRPLPERRASLRRTLGRLLALVADRPRRIDAWIDYFGTGVARRTTICAHPRGSSLSAPSPRTSARDRIAGF